MKVFLTTGTQEPFDRLIKAIDSITLYLEDITIIAQTPKSYYQPKNIQVFDFLDPSEFDFYFTEADLIVSHAGMGTVISALEKEKPIIIFPRLIKYKEHRSDHQMATAIKLKELNYVHVAFEEEELKSMIMSAFYNELKPLYKLGNYASDNLIIAIREAIHS
ncbi:glycosyltransferase [Pontibacter populi]|uniref:Glycosyltransferase n=1 Tax=Pontibacter populi TaxID=890055 RepID=A0ABV1RX21_9BACT